MRTLVRMLLAAAVVSLATLPARADEPKHDTTDIKCDIHPEKDDVVLKDQDVVIEAGRKVKDAVAVDGNVVLKRGAKVHSAVALNGSVTLEEGAVVAENAVAFHGKVKLASGAKVKGSRVWIDKALHVIDERGDHVNVDLSFAGVSLDQWLFKNLLKDFHGCHVVESE